MERTVGQNLFFIFRTIAIVYLVLAGVSDAVQHFSAEPESVTAKLGENVTLPCKVSDRKGTVQWTKDGFGLGTNRTLQGFNRYTMTGSSEEG